MVPPYRKISKKKFCPESDQKRYHSNWFDGVKKMSAFLFFKIRALIAQRVIAPFEGFVKNNICLVGRAEPLHSVSGLG